MRSFHDVIVVGGGPAGSTLAHELAGRGVDVLVVDKAVFPRRKCCGGGVTVKAARLLGEEFIGVAGNPISSASLSFSGSGRFHGEQDRAVMYTVERENLDQFLLERADRVGAEILQGLTVTGVSWTDKDVEVVTGAGNFRGEFVVAADGNRSVVARSVSLGDHDQVVGIETEVVVGDEDLADWKSKVLIDLGRTRRGYAWLFPKKDHLSIGIASPIGDAGNLKRAFWQFLDSLGLSRHTIASWSAGFIPMYVGKPRVVHGRVVLLGDAAGLADPFTGEGICNAVLSAQLAAPAIQNALLHGRSELNRYQTSVDERIGTETEAARFLYRIIDKMPRRLLGVMKVDSRIWNAGCALLRGETSYSAIKDRVGALGGLYSFLRRR